MTDYSEITSSTDNSDDYFSVAPLDLAEGDTLTGSMGPRDGGLSDSSDEFSFNVVAGQTYTFTISGYDADTAIDLFLNTSDPASAPRVSHVAGDGQTTLTLTFTATESGVLTLGIDAGFSAPDAATTYTVAVVEIAEPGMPSMGDDDLIGNMTANRIDLMAGDDRYIALGGSDVVTGGDGNDYINAVCGNDYVTGDAGNDTILGGNGDDMLLGGTGDDVMNGDNNNDTLIGGDGNDVLGGDHGADLLDGGDGNDTLTGGKEDDVLIGGAGADVFVYGGDSGGDTITDFGTGADRIDVSSLGFWEFAQLTLEATAEGGVRISLGGTNAIILENTLISDLDASDFIFDVAPEISGTGGNDTLIGGESGETLDGGYGDDVINANGGNDTVMGGAGNDRLSGGDGDDDMDGGIGADRMYGNDGNDTMYGMADNDILSGGNGNDFVDGGTGNDRIYGNDGKDKLFGGDGNDRMWGGNDSDILMGGAGKDIMVGEAGDDTLAGGQDDDTMAGGSGADTFIFEDGMMSDVITDFENGLDQLDFSSFGFMDISDLTVTQIGSDLELRVSNRDAVLLLDTDISEIDNSDFIWAEDVFLV